MVNYFIDTNVLVGYCYLQNRWQYHTDRLLSTDNTLHTSETVLYEYCLKNDKGAPDGSENIDWGSKQGIFGRIARKLRKGKRHTELELRRYDEGELNPELVADIFIEKFDIQDEVTERIRTHFNKTLNSDCNAKDARKEIDELVNRITTTANKRKSELSNRVQVNQRFGDHAIVEGQLLRLIYDDDTEYGPDAELLTDAYDLNSRGIVSKVVTGDKGDIYLNAEEIHSITGLTVMYLKDKFADTAV